MPNAKVVIDRFHVVKLVINALNNFKISLSKKINENSINSREVKKLLLSNLDKLNENELEKLNNLFQKIPELEAPYALKEEFRVIYECKSREDAEQAYTDWVNKAKLQSACYDSVINTINRWHEYIFNYFDNRYTNGITECLNNVIKSIERLGRGYSFEVLRAKVLFLNPATKPAKFSFTKSGLRSDLSMGMMYSFDFNNLGRTKVYKHGSGTDIFELQQLIEKGLL